MSVVVTSECVTLGIDQSWAHSMKFDYGCVNVKRKVCVFFLMLFRFLSHACVQFQFYYLSSCTWSMRFIGYILSDKISALVHFRSAHFYLIYLFDSSNENVIPAHFLDLHEMNVRMMWVWCCSDLGIIQSTIKRSQNP